MPNHRNKWSTFAVLIVFLLTSCSAIKTETALNSTKINNETPLRVAIAPYEDMSILVNAKTLKLEERYGTRLEFLTMPWEELLPAIASAGQTADISFASLCDYLVKENNLNAQENDPVLYIYPSWVFHGGGFISFNPKVPEINSRTIQNPEIVKKFLSFKLGVQKNSCNQLLLWALARHIKKKLSDLPITDITFNDGILAAENGSLDIAGAGTTQQAEAIKRHGRVVLTMDTLGLTAPAGFICKRSVYNKRKKDIESLIRMWFDCTDYMLSDINQHSNAALIYLKSHASTQPTLTEYKRTLALEYFPRSVAEAEEEIVSRKGKYSIDKATEDINRYLIDIRSAKSAHPVPKPIVLDN